MCKGRVLRIGMELGSAYAQSYHLDYCYHVRARSASMNMNNIGYKSYSKNLN